MLYKAKHFFVGSPRICTVNTLICQLCNENSLGALKILDYYIVCRIGSYYYKARKKDKKERNRRNHDTKDNRERNRTSHG